MKRFLPILVLVCSGWSHAAGPSQTQSAPASQPGSSTGAAAEASTQSAANPPVNAADENTGKAKAVIEQAFQALGGEAYLNIRDREQQGRGYAFHHGRSSGDGVLFWSFAQFPDKERDELTKERDIAELYVGNKGWEITYKGAHPVEEKDLTDYLRRRRFSLDTLLRTWVNDPRVVLLYEGN